MLKSAHTPKAQQGFTLIEIVIAVAILALLATTVAPMVMKHLADAKVAKMIQITEALETACVQYNMDTGDYAREYSTNTQTANHSLSMDPGTSGWDGPYLDQMISESQNPWTGRIQLFNSLNALTGNGYDLYGSGSVTHSGVGNSLVVWNVSEQVAERIDAKLDGDLPGDWKSAGRVEYNSGRLCIYIYQ